MSVRLSDLEPELLQHGEREGGQRFNQPVDSLADAHGLFFLCPVCFAANGGPVGTHGVIVTFAGRGVPEHLGSRNTDGGPSRWSVSGTGLSDLSTQPSIWLKTAPCGWHGFITNGEVTQ